MTRAHIGRMLFATTMLVTPATVHAQQTSSTGQHATALDEVIVTAQKRSERLADVPLSITAATAQQLSDAGVHNPSDLTRVVPGFTAAPSNYGFPVYSIRGIGFFDNTAATSPTVTVYLDQVPLPYSVLAAGTTLDLERVEVLKGPQGTLFGQNSTGGAINFIAAKPTKELSYGGSAELTNFGKGSVEGFVSGPLSDTLGVRLALRTEQGGAWQKSVTRPGEKLGDSDFTTGRMILDWAPSDKAHLELNVNGWIDKSDLRAAQYVRYSPTSTNYTDPAATLLATPAAPRDDRHADWDPNTNMKRDNKYYQVSLRGEFDLSDAIKLTTISAYSHLDMKDPTDPDGTQYNNLYILRIDTFDIFSQEVRLSGVGLAEKLKWMIGANYGNDDTKNTQISHYTATNSGVGPRRYHDFSTIGNAKNKTAALFGSVDYQLTDTVSVQGSARYTNSTLDGTSCLKDTGNGQLAAAISLLSNKPLAAGSCVTFSSPTVNGPPPFTPVGGFVKNRLKEDNVAWRGNVSWKPNSDVHLYVNVTKGYKAGSFSTLPLVFSAQYQPVPQESVVAYEAGFKVAALNRTLQASGAAFYYDYQDKQLLGYVLTPFGNLPALVTVPKSRVMGAELDVNWRPIEGLTLNAGVTHIDTEVRGSSITRDPFAQNININGYSFPFTPKWQASGDAEYAFPVADALEGFVGGHLTYRSSTPLAFGGGAEFIAPAYTLVDLRAGIEAPGGKWRMQVWGRNIFDKFYVVNATHIIDTVTRVSGTPATYGVTVSTLF